MNVYATNLRGCWCRKSEMLFPCFYDLCWKYDRIKEFVTAWLCMSRLSTWSTQENGRTFGSINNHGNAIAFPISWRAEISKHFFVFCLIKHMVVSVFVYYSERRAELEEIASQNFTENSPRRRVDHRISWNEVKTHERKCSTCACHYHNGSLNDAIVGRHRYRKESSLPPISLWRNVPVTSLITCITIIHGITSFSSCRIAHFSTEAIKPFSARFENRKKKKSMNRKADRA